MVDVFKTIITMRTQRPGLVANAVRKLTINRLQYPHISYIHILIILQEQFRFIHEALITMLLRYAAYSNFSDNNITDAAVYVNLPTSSM